MPRTKITRNQKRNRATANEESMQHRLREFDTVVEQAMSDLDLAMQTTIEHLTAEFSLFQQNISKKNLNTKLGDLFVNNIKNYKQLDEFNDKSKESSSISQQMSSSALVQSNRQKSKGDEGYLTEDNASCSSGSTVFSKKGRTPLIGPLSSAKAKSRRRSQSVCGYFTAPKPASTVDRSSRSKFRTPFEGRTKAASADRADPVTPKVAPNTPLFLLRYPKAGETVISLSGSPVVAQSIQDPIANVNIPIRNGVISLRPAKMQNIDPEIMNHIDSDTLNQIKQLQSNLDIIMSYADREFC